MKEAEPTYSSILPAKVRYDKRLTPGAKIFYSEIAAKIEIDNYRIKPSKYYAKLYCVRYQTINNWIKELEKEGYIITRISNDGIRSYRSVYLV